VIKIELLNDWKEELKTNVIASMGDLNINSKTITLLIGQSLAGKTATCLHYVDSAIKKKKKVLYVDTDQKSILTRPEPNLFKHFYNKNKELYDKYFLYTQSGDFDGLLKMDKYPELLIIDSIYTPFLINEDNPRTRAKTIKDFIYKLRNYIWKNNIATIITTPIGRVVNKGKDEMKALGGEGLKYASDIKIFIHFADDDDKDKTSSDKRFFVVDRQRRYGFIIENGGIIKEYEKKKV